jgi:release factor glutamine methyltransferase
MNFKEFLAAGKEQLSTAGIDPVDAEHLMAYVLGISRMDLHNPIIVEDRLAGFEDLTILEETFWRLLDARAAHQPLQYLTGVAYFRYLDIQVGPGVLVPRPESELLVQSVLDHCEKLSGIISVVDLGAGSGALALAISTENPRTRVIAVEKDSAAIEWLKKNVSQINEQVRIVESDVVDALEGVKNYPVMLQTMSLLLHSLADRLDLISLDVLLIPRRDCLNLADSLHSNILKTKVLH